MGPKNWLTCSIPPNDKIDIKCFKSINTHTDYSKIESSYRHRFQFKYSNSEPNYFTEHGICNFLSAIQLTNIFWLVKLDDICQL